MKHRLMTAAVVLLATLVWYHGRGLPDGIPVIDEYAPMTHASMIRYCLKCRVSIIELCLLPL